MTNEQPAEPGTSERLTVTAHRTPRYGRIMILTAIIFVIVSIFIASSFEPRENVDRNAAIGLFAVFAAALGLAVGGVIALIMGRLAQRRSAQVEVVHEHLSDPAEDEPTQSTTTAATDTQTPVTAASKTVGATSATFPVDSGIEPATGPATAQTPETSSDDSPEKN